MLESGFAFVLFEAAIVFGLPLAFAVRELWVLLRDARAAAAARPQAPVVVLPRRSAPRRRDGPPDPPRPTAGGGSIPESRR